MRIAVFFLVWMSALPGLGQDLTSAQKRDVFEAIAQALHERFYDENLNGVDWIAVEEKYLPRFEAAADAAELRGLAREVLNLVDASHMLVSSREERSLSSNVLPFVFEHVDGRAFVSGVLEPTSGNLPAISFGDEILTVDGAAAFAMQPFTLRGNRSPVGNPYFGASGSTASVRLKHKGEERTVELARRRRWGGFKTQTLRSLPGGVALVTLLTIGQPDALRALLEEAFSHRAVLFDLRNNGGGVDQASQPLLSALLGPGRTVDVRIPRELEGPLPAVDYQANPPDYAEINDLLESGHRVRMLTYEVPARFDGPVAVLIGPNTQSQAEAIAAALKHNGRARLFGQRTAGAVNGSQLGIALPHDVGGISVPWYNSAFADGEVIYEGIGVPPDREVRNSAGDFEDGRDRVLETALAHLRRSP